MICSVLFAYTLFALIYLFYYLLETPYKEDTMIVYHLVSLFSATIMSAGIRIEVNRIKKIRELNKTRRELAALYGQKDTSYLRPSI
jgi:EamA domain-containing membrane protein RarD